MLILSYGILNKVDIYNSFINGVKNSFSMILNLFPSLLSMILAVNIFTSSGFLNFILSGFTSLSIPSEVLPLAIMRPISGSASLAYLNNIFATKGPDSYSGLLGSVMQGSTDTTLYIISLYFGFIGIKKTRYSLIVCLFADLIGIIASIIITSLLFK